MGMESIARFAVTFIATWVAVVLLLALYEGSTPEGYRTLDSKAKRIMGFAVAVALCVAAIAVGIGTPPSPYLD